MQIAIKHGFVTGEPIIDDDGRIGGADAGSVLVRRMLRIFPGAAVVAERSRTCDGFETVRLDELDAARTLVINMDVIDSLAVWQTLHSRGHEPRLMNFIWTAPNQYHHPVNFAALGLSCALFPTFCNSQHSADWVTDVVHAWVLPAVAEQSRLGWVNLGVSTDRVQARRDPEIPVVLYPAIHLDERKNPLAFAEVLERVAARVPLATDIRLHPRDLNTPAAHQLGRRLWARVGPVTPSKDEYWEALAGTTAFLATAVEESYGLEYIEAMLAGAIGIFPERPWARALLPESYPFVYRDLDEAAHLLERALTHTEECRREVDACAGGDLAAWIRHTHAGDDFARALAHAVDGWFGE